MSVPKQEARRGKSGENAIVPGEGSEMVKRLASEKKRRRGGRVARATLLYLKSDVIDSTLSACPSSSSETLKTQSFVGFGHGRQPMEFRWRKSTDGF